MGYITGPVTSPRWTIPPPGQQALNVFFCVRVFLSFCLFVLYVVVYVVVTANCHFILKFLWSAFVTLCVILCNFWQL